MKGMETKRRGDWHGPESHGGLGGSTGFSFLAAGFGVTRMAGGHINGVYGFFFGVRLPSLLYYQDSWSPSSLLVVVGAWTEAKEKDTDGGLFFSRICLQFGLEKALVGLWEAWKPGRKERQ